MSDAIRSHLGNAYRAIRTINRAIDEPGHLTVADTRVITERVADLARALDQCACHLARNLDQRVGADDLRHPTGGDPIETTLSAAANLRSAAHQIAAAAQFLDHGRHELAHIVDFAPLIHDPDVEDQTQ